MKLFENTSKIAKIFMMMIINKFTIFIDKITKIMMIIIITIVDKHTLEQALVQVICKFLFLIKYRCACPFNCRHAKVC